MDESLSQSLLCPLGRWPDCLWSADTHLHYLNALVTVAFSPSKEEPMDKQPLSSLDFKQMLRRSSWSSPTSPHPVARATPSRAGSRREGEAISIWSEEKGKSLVIPKRKQHLGRGSLPATPVCPLKIPLKSYSSKQWSLHKLCSAECIWFGILLPFDLTGKLFRCLICSQLLARLQHGVSFSLHTVTRFPCCISHCTDQLPWVSMLLSTSIWNHQ